jgi:hypothetical protein
MFQNMVRVPKKFEQMLIDSAEQELGTPCSNVEIAEALHVASLWAPDNQVVKVIRRLAFERDKLREHSEKTTE